MSRGAICSPRSLPGHWDHQMGVRPQGRGRASHASALCGSLHGLPAMVPPGSRQGNAAVSQDSHSRSVFFFFFLKELLYLFIYLFIYLWLCWVFVSVRGLSLVAASGGHSSSRCAGLSLSRSLLLRSTGSRRAGSVVVAHGPSCSAACGIFPDQGSNPCPLHWQADSQPLRHQGSPQSVLPLCFGPFPLKRSVTLFRAW